MVGLSRKRVFPKTKGDSITGKDRAQKHCDFRFSQIEKKSKVTVLQLRSILTSNKSVDELSHYLSLSCLKKYVDELFCRRVVLIPSRLSYHFHFSLFLKPQPTRAMTVKCDGSVYHIDVDVDKHQGFDKHKEAIT